MELENEREAMMLVEHQRRQEDKEKGRHCLFIGVLNS
jgi:hypothetical protein